MKFDLFHLSLNENSQKDLFESKRPTREEYLRHVFAKPAEFDHYGTVFEYRCAIENGPNSEIVGRIGKKISIDANLPPEEGLVEKEVSAWKASFVIIDPTSHPFGQRVALEVDRTITAKPLSLFIKLVNSINEQSSNLPYHIHVSPILNTDDFWRFVSQYEGKVTDVTFDFIPPNMFGTSDEISEELKEYRDIEKAQKVTVQLKNKNGLNPDTRRTRAVVDYIGKGQGSIKASAKTHSGRKSYSSKVKGKSSSVKKPPVEEGGGVINWIMMHIKAILDNE